MNDVVFRMQVTEEIARERRELMDWEAMEDHCNDVSFGALDYDSPRERMAKLLSGTG